MSTHFTDLKAAKICTGCGEANHPSGYQVGTKRDYIAPCYQDDIPETLSDSSKCFGCGLTLPTTEVAGLWVEDVVYDKTPHSETWRRFGGNYDYTATLKGFVFLEGLAHSCGTCTSLERVGAKGNCKLEAKLVLISVPLGYSALGSEVADRKESYPPCVLYSEIGDIQS